MPRLVGLAIAALLVGGAVATAAESGGPSLPPPADQLGRAWFADPTNPPAPAGAYAGATWTPPSALATAPQPPSDAPPEDLPPGIPHAARQPEPALPVPEGWSFGEGFPRTSGAGRYANGAYLWSDFLYDDNGAIGVPPPTNESTGAPSFGTYKYVDPDAAGNGADIFRAAIGVKHKDTRGAGPFKDTTVWRVDWNTLVDPSFPIAAFVIDDDPATGVDDWPANARLKSPGIDRAIVVSGTSARVLDLVNRTEKPARLTVDLAARSFVVTTDAIPRTRAAVIRLAAGIADEDGTGFRTLTQQDGALPGQPNVYNVAFRDYADEPSSSNPWYDTTQAKTLTTGADVSAFAATVEWSRLAERATEPEPLLPGYTNRWYVSSWPRAWDAPDRPAAQGVVASSGISTSGPPAYVGRVQPYAVYVPTTYNDDVPAPLTLMLHGASSSHNSAQIHPRYTLLACERRGSICLGPLGRGPSGGWRDYAELDVWETWNRVAATYVLDADRTIISGISMGAFGTYKLAMDHPEAFAAAVTIVGHANQSETGHNRLTNLRWTPLYARHGTFDQLVPITGEIATQNELDRLQLRHVYDYQPVEDHIVVALKDAYDDVAEFMAMIDRTHPRDTRPARIDYAWDQPPADRAAMGITRPGAWWLDGVQARVATTRARIAAHSLGLPDPPVTIVDRTEPRVLGSPSPTIRHVIAWTFGTAPAAENRATLSLTNVGAVTVDLLHAGLASGGEITVTTDGPTTITLGTVAHEVGAGTHVLTVP